jgi:subtilisin family serine protease
MCASPLLLGFVVVLIAAASTEPQIGNNYPGAPSPNKSGKQSSAQQIGSSWRRGSSSEQMQHTLRPRIHYLHVTHWESTQSSDRPSLNVATTNTNLMPTSNVPYYGGANDWNLNAINAPQVWARGYTGSGIVVAVIDTGVDYRHSDLVNNMWVNGGEIAGNRRDDDGNGYVDDDRGWDFAHDDNNPLDLHGHGTHVAGTIAAARNDAGTTGVAYGARIMPLQVFDAYGVGYGNHSLAAAIRYAVNNGADIINLSVWWDYSPAVARALNYASQRGVFVVAASGNFAQSVPAFPARFSAHMSHVISVGAHTSSNSLAGFSNRVGGSRALKIDAPGINVYSTLPDNRYGYGSGTSMAAPHVAGVAALALSANRNLTPSQLRQMIVAGSNRLISGSDSRGGINAALVIAWR